MAYYSSCDLPPDSRADLAQLILEFRKRELPILLKYLSLGQWPTDDDDKGYDDVRPESLMPSPRTMRSLNQTCDAQRMAIVEK